ncbi:thioesterase domain-containing protein, partial [Neorhizobium sp. DT-125]|uniref:thioesterase domain-containing protein n=1 Tax=Neorhizobium sp. DT-125 TaxID=3396163 RepID=UPI003F195C2F
RNETEAALAAIWQDVLGLDRVGVNDNFFEIGGDSISLLRAWSRMIALSGRSIPLAQFLDHPVIDGFVRADSPTSHIRQLNEAAAGAPPVFCIHPGFGLVTDYRLLAEAAGRDFAVYGIESPIHGDARWTVPSMAGLARHYLETIRTVQPNGPYRLIGWSFGGWIALEIARLIEASSDGSVSFVGLIDTEPCRDFRPFAKTETQWRETVKDELAHLGISDNAELSENLLAIAMLHQALLLDYRPEPILLSIRTHVWWAEATTAFYGRRGEASFLDWNNLLPSGTVASIIDSSSHGDIIHYSDLVNELWAAVPDANDATIAKADRC